MIIEVLFGEVCNLFGDSGNISFLKASLPDAQWIDTPLNRTPYFVKNDVDMIYLGSGTESIQKRVLEKLKPFTDRIKELISRGKVILITGNMLDILGKSIDYGDERVDALGITKLEARIEKDRRYNSLFLGKFENMEIVGFNSRFSHSYDEPKDMGFMQVERGAGVNRESTTEGIHINNLFATYIIGPLLPLNPPFTKYIMSLLGVSNPHVAYEDAAMEAYNRRLLEIKNPDTKLN